MTISSHASFCNCNSIVRPTEGVIFFQASGAPLLTSSSPLRATHLEPHFSGNTLLSSTPAHPSSSTVYNRPLPQTGYPVNQHHSHRQNPYSEFSYHDPSHQRASNLPASGYLLSDRWQTPEYYDSHRQFDSRVHQGQFAASSREPENVYYRAPDQYSTSPGGLFYDRQPPHGEFPRNVPPDPRYMHPDIPHGQSQGTRPAAPYEPRTELQKTFLTHRNQPGPYNQDGLHAHYHDGRQDGYRSYGGQRPDGFEPHRMERGIVNGRDDGRQDRYRSYGDQRPEGFEPHRMERGIVNGRDEAQVDKVCFHLHGFQSQIFCALYYFSSYGGGHSKKRIFLPTPIKSLY